MASVIKSIFYKMKKLSLWKELKELLSNFARAEACRAWPLCEEQDGWKVPREGTQNPAVALADGDPTQHHFSSACSF